MDRFSDALDESGIWQMNIQMKMGDYFSDEQVNDALRDFANRLEGVRNYQVYNIVLQIRAGANWMMIMRNIENGA